MKRLLVIFAAGIAAGFVACGGETTQEEATPTARTDVPGSSSHSEIGPDGSVLPTPQPEIALSAAIESISGFDVTDVSFRGDDVTVKYNQVVNEPPELLLLRWLDFASVAATLIDDPMGDIVLVPQVENSDIASVRLRAVDVIDYLDGKRPLEDVLASIEIE